MDYALGKLLESLNEKMDLLLQAAYPEEAEKAKGAKENKK